MCARRGKGDAASGRALDGLVRGRGGIGRLARAAARERARRRPANRTRADRARSPGRRASSGPGSGRRVGGHAGPRSPRRRAARAAPRPRSVAANRDGRGERDRGSERGGGRPRGAGRRPRRADRGAPGSPHTAREPRLADQRRSPHVARQLRALAAMQLSTLTRIPQTVRNLARLREIVRVLVKYGWGDLVPRLGPAATIERLRRRIRREAAPEPEWEAFTTEQRIRMAFEELGPTFIKLGQVLATRPDLIPMSLVEELRLLQDRVPPFPAVQARAEIERELGHAVEELFASFDDTPLAAASIAQVHRAVLRDGSSAVVKVRRPGLEAVIANDLDILSAFAAFLEDNVPETRQYSPRAIADEFRRSIWREI